MPEYAIIARKSVEHDGPLLYSVEGLERLARARRQWAYIEEHWKERMQRRAEQRARGEAKPDLRSERHGNRKRKTA